MKKLPDLFNSHLMAVILLPHPLNPNNGDVSGNHGVADAWVVKAKQRRLSNGRKRWVARKEEIARSVQPTTDGGYIVAGSAKSSNGDVSGNHGGQDDLGSEADQQRHISVAKITGWNDDDFANSIQPQPMGAILLPDKLLSNNGDVSRHHEQLMPG
jgi:hypothetical protein